MLTHDDKIVQINKYLQQLARDAQRLDPRHVDEVLSEVDRLVDLTGNWLYDGFGADIIDTCD